MMQRLEQLVTKNSPFAPDYAPTKGRWSRRAKRSERWVQPSLVVEVSFAEWTPDGSVRHTSFEGFRADKKPTDVKRES